jgi:transposase
MCATARPLFATLNVAAGTVSGRCFPRHRHQEFLRFLRQIDSEYAPELELHLVMDNYGAHKTEQVKRWLKRHPRFKVHFIPTSSSWLNMVERWFAEITGKAVRRGSFSSVPDLVAAIEEFIEEWNRDPKPLSERRARRISSRRSSAVGVGSRKSNPVAWCAAGEKGPRNVSSHLRGTTLANTCPTKVF